MKTLLGILKGFFIAPVFDGDNKKTQSAKTLFQIIKVIWGLPVLLIVIMVVNPAGSAEVIPPIIVISVILLALMIFSRAGWVGFANYIIVGMVIFVFAYADYGNAGDLQPSALVSAIAIVMSGLLLGRRAPIVTAILIAAAHAFIVYLQTQGTIEISSAPVTGAQNMISTGIILLLTGFLLQFVMSRLQSALDEARENEGKLQTSNRELQEFSASLEARVAERTHAADLARAEAESARADAEFQAWSSRGHAQLSEQMRGDLDLPTLTNNITSHLSRYIGAHTGALFVASGDVLKLTGRYAYAERAGQKSEFRLGESLIGEAAKSKRIILVDDIPADAPLVSSALGEALPRQIIIAPLESNGQVLGVIELAALTQFTPEHQDFLKRVSESVAIALRTASTRLQMSELLSRSQQQAEELQAQEEELRASNEELQAQAEFMRGGK